MSISGRINKDFKDYVGNSQLYMHEYGHSLQSQMIGLSYLFAIGLPSLGCTRFPQNVENNVYGDSSDDFFYTETWANQLASRYFSIFKGYEWDERDGYPFHDYR